MRTKFLYIVAMVLLVSFTACEKVTPFDSQTANDDPIILRPYGESGSGSFNYTRDSDKPLVDSVVVIPSSYTTVNWYVDGQLVHTGNKINMYFPVGKYTMRIEAVTTAGKKTYRDGSLTVNPIATDPNVTSLSGEICAVPGVETTFGGANLDKVAKLLLTSDIFAEEELCSVVPSSKAPNQIKFTLPAMEEGEYYFRLLDGAGNVYGCDKISVFNGSVALSGFDTFVPGEEWVISGASLQNVASLKLDETVITTLTVTATSVTLTAPDVAIGEHTLSMLNKDGKAVRFVTEAGVVSEVKVTAKEAEIPEIELWKGPEYIVWAERMRVTKEVMTQVPAGATINIYWEKLPSGHEGYLDNGTPNEYWKMRVMSAWWTDLFPEFEVDDTTPNPYTFTYTQTMKTLVESEDGLVIAGWGLQLNKITYK